MHSIDILHVFLNPKNYMSVGCWSFISTHRTVEARINNKIKRILAKFEAWCIFIRASSGTSRCIYRPILALILWKYNNLPLVSIIQLCLTYPHFPDEAQIYICQASYLESICFFSLLKKKNVYNRRIITLLQTSNCSLTPCPCSSLFGCFNRILLIFKTKNFNLSENVNKCSKCFF